MLALGSHPQALCQSSDLAAAPWPTLPPPCTPELLVWSLLSFIPLASEWFVVHTIGGKDVGVRFKVLGSQISSCASMLPEGLPVCLCRSASLCNSWTVRKPERRGKAWQG